MKFKEYILENEDIDSIISKIKNNCQPFLKDWLPINKKIIGQEAALYSGRRGENTKIVFRKLNVRKNRKPSMTNGITHKYLDEIFDELFKIKARSQCLFATSSYQQSTMYGYPYIVFPIGRYEVIWSSNVPDLYTSLVDAALQFGDYDELYDFINNADYKKGNLKNAIYSRCEIMVYCNKVYLLKNGEYDMKELKEKLK